MDHHDHPQYTCPMHPQVNQEKPGKCPFCGMDLVLVKKSEHDHARSSHSMTYQHGGNAPMAMLVTITTK